MSAPGRCNLCGHEFPRAAGLVEAAEDIAHHLRLMHPETGDAERWPDGGLVLHDDDPDPSDYEEVAR